MGNGVGGIRKRGWGTVGVRGYEIRHGWGWKGKDGEWEGRGMEREYRGL